MLSTLSLCSSFLPLEIWQRIAYFVPRMKEQPFWHAWTLRTVNRVFRFAIEDYYFHHYVRKSAIHFRVKRARILHSGGCVNFMFSHFNDENGRIAVFTTSAPNPFPKDCLAIDPDLNGCDAMRSSGASTMLMLRALTPPDLNHDGSMIMSIRHDFTDMLPLDLQAGSVFGANDCSLNFDWRIYYSTYFDAERVKAGMDYPRVCGFDNSTLPLTSSRDANLTQLQTT